MKNIFQKIKTGKNLIKRIVKKGETVQTYLKEDNIPDEYVEFFTDFSWALLKNKIKLHEKNKIKFQQKINSNDSIHDVGYSVYD